MFTPSTSTSDTLQMTMTYNNNNNRYTRTKKIRAKHIKKKKYQEKEAILITRLLCEIKRVLFRWKFVGANKKEMLCEQINSERKKKRNQRFHGAQITNARESIIQSFVDCSISPMRMVSLVCGRAATERQIFNNAKKSIKQSQPRSVEINQKQWRNSLVCGIGFFVWVFELSLDLLRNSWIKETIHSFSFCYQTNALNKFQTDVTYLVLWNDKLWSFWNFGWKISKNVYCKMIYTGYHISREKKIERNL